MMHRSPEGQDRPSPILVPTVSEREYYILIVDGEKDPNTPNTLLTSEMCSHLDKTAE